MNKVPTPDRTDMCARTLDIQADNLEHIWFVRGNSTMMLSTHLISKQSLDVSHLAQNLIQMHGLSVIPVPYFGPRSHTSSRETRKNARWSIPRTFSIWRTGFCLPLHLPLWPLLDPGASWWITCRPGWIVPPPHFLHLLCGFIISSLLICHSRRSFITSPGLWALLIHMCLHMPTQVIPWPLLADLLLLPVLRSRRGSSLSCSDLSHFF